MTGFYGNKKAPTELKRLWRLWRNELLENEWLLLGVAWLGVLVLGLAGFAQNATALGKTYTFWDLLYQTLQLIPLNSGNVEPPISLELNAARFLFPVLAASTAVKALAGVFLEQAQRMSLWSYRGHVVICGLSRKGYLLAQGFDEQHERVVVIEKDEENPWIEPCREMGVIVLIGDATDEQMLRKAQTQRARLLAAVSEDDGVNAEIAVKARAVAQKRKSSVPLVIVVHLVDGVICQLLRGQELSSNRLSVRYEFFNVFDRGAWLMLQQLPLPDCKSNQNPPHILVVGLGNFGESLVIHAAREWREQLAGGAKRLKVTVVDRVAHDRLASMRVHEPRLDEVCEFTVLQMDVHSAEFEQAQFILDEQGHNPFDSVYVCLDSDTVALHAGLVLYHRCQRSHVPVIVRMAEESGLARLLQDHRNGLQSFGLLNRTCTPELLLGGLHELLARAIHAEYVRVNRASGKTLEEKSALVVWDKLPEALKESNRQQADHIGVKLEAIGYQIAPLSFSAEPLEEFTEAEVEHMAQLEHDRFVAERSKKGGSKDIPNLAPWRELDEQNRNLDRNAVKTLPQLLERAGLQIVRR